MRPAAPRLNTGFILSRQEKRLERQHAIREVLCFQFLVNKACCVSSLRMVLQGGALARATTALSIDTRGQGGCLARSESAPGLPLRSLSGMSPGAQSKTWSTPPGTPESIASRQPTADGWGRAQSDAAALKRAEQFDVKKQVQAELKASQQQLQQSGQFVPSFAAINAVASLPSFARYPERMMQPPSADAPWPPYATAPGFVEVAAGSAQTSATAFQSVAPRMLVGTPTYNGYDPRALLADGRYGGYHTNDQFDATDWTPQYAGGLLRTSRSRTSQANPPTEGLQQHAVVVNLDPLHSPARRRRRSAPLSSPEPKPGLARAVSNSSWRCSTAFQSRQPRLLGGQPTYRGHDLRQIAADDAYTGSHVHMYQPPTNRDTSPPPGRRATTSPAELAQQRLERPLHAPLDDEYRAAAHESTISSDDRFRYGVVVKYPTRVSATFASTMHKVASNYPKPLEPYPRGRPGVELNAPMLSSFTTRQKAK